MQEKDDILRYSIENVRRQAADAEAPLGFHLVRFYTVNGRPAKEPTGTVGAFYYFPSGGTIRDSDMNVLFYEPRLDAHRSAAG